MSNVPNHPEPHPIQPLSQSSQRALAAFGLTTLTGLPPVTAATVIDVLDAVSWAVLAAAGATPVEARGLLAGLWEQGGDQEEDERP